MFERILIANRGEIAVRIIRACKEMGIQTVAIYSEPDAQSLHVQLADTAICVGPASSAASYLKISNIISAAEISDVDAIHPGYGFMAENAHFAEICENCNIKFIGPSPDNIRRMGDKAVARDTMKAAGVPITPGSEGIVQNKEDALKLAHAIGYPVLIKAVSGGGGKGMRVAHNDVSLAQAFMTASSEADRAFGDARLYLEKYVESARHIEVQVLADHFGNVVHLGERDCSIQRRHQKLVEEAPSPALTDEIRQMLGETAVRAASAVNYRNAGTIEFLYDEKAQQFYFMEMNTRIQVEHPVTEEVSGIDLIKEQIRIAAGEPLGYTQDDLCFSGHAIELRINAENPFKNFTPSPGLVEWVHFPGGKGVRVDSHVYSGYRVSPHYDSMIGKLIVHAKTRDEAIRKMSRCLDEFMIQGVSTTVPLAQAIMTDARFVQGQYNTHYLDNFLRDGVLH
ncbi:MAG: acetyl-CoA carboxylase biotin carboxylase subunit [Kiritimatiellae bacterium]|nr:acetyl-CoA carboxylase biotin carboxylase subunit [Kiritimatiellia bacterium]